jgi:hypothetical protein
VEFWLEKFYMKRFLLAVTLCFSLLLVGLFAFMPSAGAQDNILLNLLNMPAPPPPNPLFRINQVQRDENFYDKKNPPPDNASAEDLLDYWKRQNQFDPKYTYTVKPSEKSFARLMAEIEKKPASLTELIGTLPNGKESAEFVKRLYDEEVSRREFEPSWRDEVKRWLTYHSNYFSDELYQTASQTAETEEYVTNQDEVLALARVDWDKARPLLERMLGNSQTPVSQTLARWAFYQHALAVNDSFDIDKYRKELQETVENKNFQPGNRDLAMDALVESGDYQGRDEWYFSLLDDETLYELKVNGQTYTGLTTLLNHSPSDKYVEKMIELAGSGNPTIRNAAVRNLATLLDDIKNPELVKALLPWLENPKWAKEVGGERAKMVAALREYEIPESVPGLIAMLNEKENVEIRDSPNANVPVYQGNRPYNSPAVRQVDNYPYRSAAIAALEKQKSPLAIAPLRLILTQVEEWERQSVVRTLIVSNGYTIPEQLEALEETAKVVSQQEIPISNTSTREVIIDRITQANTPAMNVSPNYPRQYNPNDIRLILGNQLVNIEEVSDELVKAVIDRINYLDTKNPKIANSLRGIIQNWKGAAINSLMLRDLKNGQGTLDSVIRLLAIRKDLREKQFNEVSDLSGGSPSALGISACLLEDANSYDAILAGDNPEAKVAMLGCARLIRAALPVQKVAENLRSQDKLLKIAAERYLESEDSPAARQIVLSRHPNEAKILGAKSAFTSEGAQSLGNYSALMRDIFISVDSSFQFIPPYVFYQFASGDSDETEKKLQKEVKENQEILGIYAFDKNFVRIYKDKAVFAYEDDPARFRERTLSVEEFEALKNYLASQNVDELAPFLSNCESCEEKELLMLGRQGGRRVYVHADPLPPFFAELENIFAEMRKQPTQIRYHLEKNVAGLEVLYADENLKARTVWKNGDDFRILIDDLTLRKQTEKEAENVENSDVSEEETPDESGEVVSEKTIKAEQKIARQKEYGSTAWYKFDKTKLLETVAQPAGVEYIPLTDGFAVQTSEEQWKARANGLEIRADEEGLYKISRGQIAQIRKGYYSKPLVTPNGRWAIATKYGTEENDYARSLVRVNLLTNREFKIKIESEYPSFEAVAFLPALNKVLIFSSYEEDAEYGGERGGDYFLLDAETGLAQAVKGEVRPLDQQTFRALQPTAASADEFWTALPDSEKTETQIGVYNAKTLAFKPSMTIPQIEFDSMAMWIDEAEGKIYFVYEGQLLALPLPKQQK